MTSSKNIASTAETTPPSPNPKPGRFSTPRALTTQEIESLRQDRKRNHEESTRYFRELLKAQQAEGGKDA